MISKRYLISVTLMIVVIPIAGSVIQHLTGGLPFSFHLFGTWFIFSAAGLRLFVAGLQQSLNPAFTAKQIFNIDNDESHPIVRELGFANICFGLVGLISFFKPGWQMVSAFASGIYYGLAGLLHIIKKPASANETFALITDILVFAVLIACLSTIY